MLALFVVGGAVGGAMTTPSAADELPTVASINLCTDQLVLSLAEPEQILTVSWLSVDPEESMRADDAIRYPVNYGTAEELLRHAPDVVVAGSFTSAYTRSLLAELGYEVVEIEPANSVADVARNIEQVAAAVEQVERGRMLLAAMRERLARLSRTRPVRPVRAVVLRPGGFTTGSGSLAHELMTLAGLVNEPAEQGLDRWGSLSMETLLRTEPELLILSGYRARDASLANGVFDHPALDGLRARIPSVVVPAAQWGCGLPESLDSVETLQRAATALGGGGRNAPVDVSSKRTQLDPGPRL